MMNKWLIEILAALTNLGEEGTLEEIYNDVFKSEKIDLSPFTD
ncbi:hypothetical protein V7124_21600 [Neobacillus niacini]